METDIKTPASSHSTSGTSTRRPQWWTADNEASWNKAKTEIIADWNKVATDAKKLGDQVSDKALAFGHEARAKFAEFAVWNEDFQKKLAEDWKKTEDSASEGWAHVSDAVKHGWERARAAVKS